MGGNAALKRKTRAVGGGTHMGERTSPLPVRGTRVNSEPYRIPYTGQERQRPLNRRTMGSKGRD